MREFSVGEIICACGGELLSGDAKKNISGVVTDSRQISGGELFVPFRGERSDGHDYIESVLSGGAAAVLSERDIKCDGTVIKVKSTMEALGKIAAAYLQKYRIPVVGVTGSVGKTSTKDMISAVLSAKYNVLKSTGNHNNEIGMPLTVLGMEKEDGIAVLEMGMSAFGELHYLAEIAKPDAAVITNIGMSHIENLGSQEGILKAKLEICDFFTGDNVLFVNGDDRFLKNVDGDFEIVRYGKGENCAIRAENIEDLGIEGSRFTLVFDGKKYPVCVKAPGIHNVYNAMAAIGIGAHFGVTAEEAVRAVLDARLTDMRMTVEHAGDVMILKDFYNAAPDSVRASLSVLKTVGDRRRVAVLGDILEMGAFAEEEHKKLGKAVFENADVLITAGKNAHFIAQGAKDAGMRDVISFDDTDAAAENILKYKKPGDCVLIKASRGMKFEKIYQKYKEN